MVESSFDQDFCHFLEFHLTSAFHNAWDGNHKWERFWCDGIAVPDDIQLYSSTVTKTKQISTKGWFGYDGQTLYVVTVKFGSKALSGYLKGFSLIEFVPAYDTLNWITLDMENHEIELRLQ